MMWLKSIPKIIWLDFQKSHYILGRMPQKDSFWFHRYVFFSFLSFFVYVRGSVLMRKNVFTDIMMVYYLIVIVTANTYKFPKNNTTTMSCNLHYHYARYVCDYCITN
jgi:hypothetical protein